MLNILDLTSLPSQAAESEAITDDDDAIRNKTSIGGRAIKTIQHQNDMGVVRARKGEQNWSVEKVRPTTVQSLNFKN